MYAGAGRGSQHRDKRSEERGWRADRIQRVAVLSTGLSNVQIALVHAMDDLSYSLLPYHQKFRSIKNSSCALDPRSARADASSYKEACEV